MNETALKFISDKAVLLLTLVLFCLLLPLFSAAAGPLDGKNVLLLHSYHQTYIFTDQEMKGIMRVLRENYPGCMPYVEYMDWKRFPDERRIPAFSEQLRAKYAGIRFDMVIVTDNKALEFAVKNRSRFFPEAVVSFSGINGFRPAMLEGQKRISGVVEDVDPAGTIGLIMATLPETREIVLLIDDTESSNEVLTVVEKEIGQNKHLRLSVLRSPAQAELISAVSALKPGSVLLQGNFSRDRTGHTYEFEDVLATILPHCKVPVFSLWDFLAGKGIMGGSLLSGERQGENAARIALRLMAGEDVPVMERTPPLRMLDYRQLQRFNLEKNTPPAGVTVINRPQSFFRIHFKYVMVGAVILFLQLSAIIALIVTNRKKRRAERLLRENEEWYRTIFDMSNNAIFIHDPRTGVIVDVNERVYDMYGYSRSELANADVSLISSGQPSYGISDAKKWIDRAAHGEPQHFEWLARRKDGSLFWVDVRMRRVSIGGKDCLLVNSSDITERKQQEEVSHDSEKRLLQIIDFLPDAIMVINQQGRVIAWNRSMEELTGVASENMIGKGDYEYSIPIYGSRRPVLVDLVFMSEEERKGNKHYSSIKKVGDCLYAEGDSLVRGEKRSLWAITRPLFDSTGNAVGAIESVRDVTERKQAKDLIVKANKQLEDIIEFLPDATLIVNSERKIIAWNHAMEEMTGVSKTEVLGEEHSVTTIPFYGYRRQYIIDYILDQNEELLSNYSWFDHRGNTYNAEAFAPALYGGKGAHIWVAASPMYDDQGNMIAVIESVRDITDRRRAEEALRRSEANYRMVIENIQDVLYRGDAEGRLIMVSPSALKLLGCGSLDDFLGKSIADTFYFQPEKRSEFFELIRQHGKVTNYEVELKKHDGTPVMVETSSNAYYDENGNFAGIEGLFRDITERKKGEQERKKLEEQLIQAQKLEAIGTLAAGIAHDFNNILSGIMGYTELSLNKVKEQPKVYRNMEQVLTAANRAKDLVKQILTFCRKAHHETKPTSVIPILQEVAKFMRASLPATIELKLRIETESDIIIADSSQLHQVLVNLCTNAGYAMKDKGGVLEICLADVTVDSRTLPQGSTFAAGHCLELSVRDSGMGIEPENLPRIFDPYFTTKGPGEGTGLGLAMVHGIIKSHGGDIRVYSELGKGTVFRIYLPLMRWNKGHEEQTAHGIPQGNGQSILLVDDEEMLVEMGRIMLEELGYRVTTETDPLKAVETIKNTMGGIDLVITDKTMPHMSGFELAGKIRQLRSELPVILCSGFHEISDVEKSRGLCINQLLLKPFDLVTLANAVHAALKEPPLQTFQNT
ncbi:PAS/PAC sensor hybrid histidine kinase [Pelobacter propionicus DSM 2379]|uniref:histidine kinase n=1 Tax=Pelobacter propionicus (strain DSM 2379 / NBRC 103807 / OttBd1) TaxID=338966 RepID=A1ATS3_PELPD|nr:PAS/PAC sensor hybrid histidine kinase [Pelobacter propionicus DSM 2379]